MKKCYIIVLKINMAEDASLEFILKKIDERRDYFGRNKT